MVRSWMKIEQRSGGATIVGAGIVSTPTPDIYCKMQADMRLVKARLGELRHRDLQDQLKNLRIRAAKHLAQHPSLEIGNEENTSHIDYLWKYGFTRCGNAKSLFWTCVTCKDDGSRFTTFCTARTALTCFLEILIIADENAFVRAVSEHLRVCEAVR
jgi:hypothetical protein